MEDILDNSYALVHNDNIQYRNANRRVASHAMENVFVNFVGMHILGSP